jgi:signal transduction histidine kinase
LVENAVGAAAAPPAGSREVALAVRRQGDEAIVEVSDSGAGIPDGVSVFEPFSSTKQQGTGLGLPMVSRIASDHGGDVSFTREDGRTLFRLELPVDGPPRDLE